VYFSIYIYILTQDWAFYKKLNESFDKALLAGMGSIGNYIARRFRTG
jgi:hypothetical protein